MATMARTKQYKSYKKTRLRHLQGMSFRCSAKTSRGVECKKIVKREGDRCVWHKIEGRPIAPVWLARALEDFYPIEGVVDKVLVLDRTTNEYTEPSFPIDRTAIGTSVLLCMADGSTKIEVDFSCNFLTPLRPQLKAVGPMSQGFPEGAFLRTFDGGDWCPVFISSLTQTSLAIFAGLASRHKSPLPSHHHHFQDPDGQNDNWEA